MIIYEWKKTKFKSYRPPYDIIIKIQQSTERQKACKKKELRNKR